MDDCEGGRRHIHHLLLASASIPGIFPPVIVDGRVHADGGLAGNVMPVLDLDGYRRLARALHERGVARPVTVRLWVVVNLWLDARPMVVDPANRRISQRGNLLLFITQQRQLLARLQELAVAVDAGVPGLRLELHCTAVPSEMASEPGADALFDAAWMARLEEFGYRRARSAQLWGCDT